MGTNYTIKINPLTTAIDSVLLENEIENKLEEINNKMSTYIDNSEISMFNQYNKTNPFKISNETAEVIKHAIEISRESDGAFDITLAPLIDLWGFDKSERTNKAPSQRQIDNLIKTIGYQKLKLELKPQPFLIKSNPDLQCNLSAIAKGYAVDQVADILLSHKINNFIVEIGGEIKVYGKKNHLNWIVGIQSPKINNKPQITFPLENMALATSGDYRNFFEENGIRYSHTIDPRNGKPITHKLASVTVIHNSCMMADGFATAINVLGPKKGLELAEKENLAVYLIIRENEVFKEVMNEKFKLITGLKNG